MAKNSYGYVIVRWEVEPPQKAGDYSEVTFTVLDAGKGKTEVIVGTLKMYGKNMPKELIKKIGKAVTDAQYYQRHETPAVD